MPTMKLNFVQRWLDEQSETFFEMGLMKLSEWWWRYIEVPGEYVKKQVLLFLKKNC